MENPKDVKAMHVGQPKDGLLIEALIKARQSFDPITKDRTNPFHKAKYATLDSVLESVQPALSENGLAIVQVMDTLSGKSYLVTKLYHTSGNCIDSWYPIPELTDPQKLGAAITYARRYSVCAMLSVTADEDDDGESAKPSPKEQKRIELESEVKAEAKRVGWTGEQAKEYLTSTYPNYKGQLKDLSDKELQNFLAHLKSTSNQIEKQFEREKNRNLRNLQKDMQH